MAAGCTALNPKAADAQGSATCDMRCRTDYERRLTLADTRPLPLLAANLADAMKVKSRDDKTIGAVHALMIHKRSGRAMYAVLSLGGFLGIGKAYYAVPITLLVYDHAVDQYVALVEPKVLEGGPSWSNTAPAFDQDYADRVASYYGADKQDLEFG
jgi:hypothetical protein